MSDSIEPVITAAQWHRLGPDIRTIDGAEVVFVGQRLPTIGSAGLTFRLPTEATAVIAMLNAVLPDDDPRKITRERLGLIAEGIGNTSYVPDWDDVPKMRQFIEALKSYLPPEPQ